MENFFLSAVTGGDDIFSANRSTLRLFLLPVWISTGRSSSPTKIDKKQRLNNGEISIAVNIRKEHNQNQPLIVLQYTPLYVYYI